MGECIDVILVANAGILVRGGGTGLLVDGIHDQGGHPFHRVDLEMLTRMRQGEAPFQRLEYMLFTHEHPDHFTPGLVVEHLRSRPLRGLFTPDPAHGSDDSRLLARLAGKLGVPHWTGSLEPGQARTYGLGEGLGVTVIGGTHQGRGAAGVRNDSFLVSVGGSTLLFTGDADPVPAHFEKALAGVALDAAFVNPLFYHNPEGQRCIAEVFRPREVVICHLPDRDSDTMHLWFTLERALARHAGPGAPVRVLTADSPSLRLCAEKGRGTSIPRGGWPAGLP